MLLVVIAVLVVTTGIGEWIPLDAHEIFVSRTAQEMRERADWVVPSFNDVVRLKKPPLNYWLTLMVAGSGALSPDGVIGAVAARAPSALAGLALIWGTFALCRAWFDRMTAYLAALLVVSMFGFATYAHSARPEMVYAALCTLGLVGFVRAEAMAGVPRTRQRLTAWLGWAALGAAMLAKGPQLPVLLVVGWYVGAARDVGLRMSLRATCALSGGLLALVIAGWWYAWIIGVVPDALAAWRVETIDRYVESDRHWWQLLDPYYAYRTASLVMPWVVLYPLALLTPWLPGVRERRPALRAWWLIVIAMLGLSCSFGRRWYYMLPLLAPLAGLMATHLRGLALQIASRRGQWRWTAINAAHLVTIGIALTCLVALRARTPGSVVALLAIVGGAGIGLALLGQRSAARSAVQRAAITLGVVGLLIGSAQWTGALQSDARYERAAFAAAVRDTVPPTAPVLGWYDAWEQELQALARPIHLVGPRDDDDVIDGRDDGGFWLLVDSSDPAPIVPASVGRRIVLRHDYDGMRDRLQLWYLAPGAERHASSRSAARAVATFVAR